MREHFVEKGGGARKVGTRVHRDDDEPAHVDEGCHVRILLGAHLDMRDVKIRDDLLNGGRRLA